MRRWSRAATTLLTLLHLFSGQRGVVFSYRLSVSFTDRSSNVAFSDDDEDDDGEDEMMMHNLLPS